MSDYEIHTLLRDVRELQLRLHKLDQIVGRLHAALDTDDICEGLGHLYVPPNPVILSRIRTSGWRVERKCSRCGHVDGEWGAWAETERQLVAIQNH